MVLGIGSSTTVGMFGKLPALPDFVRLNAGSAPAREWDDWIGAALSEMRRSWGEGWEAKFDASPGLDFIARTQGDNRQVLSGHVRPSRDQSGRRYPLTVFCESQLERHGRGIQSLPVTLSPFLTEAARAASVPAGSVPDASYLNGMSALVPENPVELTRGLADYLRAVTMESFWNAVLGRFDDPRKYLCIKNVFGTLAPLRGYDPQRMAITLRFPGASHGSTVAPALVTASWTALCRAVVGDETLSRSWLFWHAGGAAVDPECFLFFRPPAAAMLAGLWDASSRNENVWDMETVGAERINESRAAVGAALAAVLDTPHYPLLDFIQQI